MSTRSSILMLVTGLAAGAVLGVLFAPRSGKETRKSLMKQGEKLRDQLSDLVGQGRDLAKEAKDKAKDAASQVKSDVRNGAPEASARAGAART